MRVGPFDGALEATMILKTVQVKNFKCINDSNVFGVDEKVTCLVGKNESGKTTLLQAISKLNSVDPVGADFALLEYPRRRMMEYQQRAETDPAEALTTTWALTPEDIADLETIVGPVASQLDSIVFRKGYSNTIECQIEIDESAVVEHLVSSYELNRDELRGVQGISSVAELHQTLAGLDTRSDRQRDLLVAVVSGFEAYSASQTVARRLENRLPKFAYFSEYLRMPGQISVNDLKSRLQTDNLEEGDRVFLALLETIGRTVDDLERIDQQEMLTAELEAASNRLTQEVFRYWTQNQSLRVQFLLQQALPGDPAPFNEGWIIRTRIQDTRFGDTINFDERSAGFVWFFSFVIWFNQLRNRIGDNLTILLDDPGLSLHANAQRDLLRYVEERLAPAYQIIYTTHSPFMIDPAKLYRARTVENIYFEDREMDSAAHESELGTKVGDHELSANADTLFPLQAALAYEISRSLFASEHSVMVDGPSEVLYFQWFKRKLAAMNRITLDDRWVVTPCGGTERVAAFLTLFAGNQLHIAVVNNYAPSQPGSDLGPRYSEVLRHGHMLTFDRYIEKGAEGAGIEDIIGCWAYVELTKVAYNLTDEMMRPISGSGKPPVRVAEEVKDHMETLPQGIKGFDRYRPAEFLVQQGAEFTLPELDKALDHFESLFRDLNAMLN
jgi:predicted ATPase